MISIPAFLKSSCFRTSLSRMAKLLSREDSDLAFRRVQRHHLHGFWNRNLNFLRLQFHRPAGKKKLPIRCWRTGRQICQLSRGQRILNMRFYKIVQFLTSFLNAFPGRNQIKVQTVRYVLPFGLGI